jgi:Ca-activated chloride channel family protein
LLSDGCANHGLLDRDQIYSQCEALAKNGVTTSTYGLGRYFDEGLMTGIAKAGRGNAYYGQTVEDLMDPFEEELAFLANLCARNVRVIVDHPSYVRVEVLNPSWGTTEPGPVDLPDLAYESQVWVMLRLHIAGAATTDKPVGTLVDLVKVTATYQTLGGQGASVVAPTLQLPLLDPPEYGAVAIDTEVTSKGAELELARIERQAYVAAQNEQWEEVERLLNVAQATTGASDWAQKTIADLRKLLARRDREGISKEMMYSMVRKERGHGERFEDESLRDGPMQSYLRKKSSQGKADPKP